MQIQVNTSNGIDNKDTLESWAKDEIQKTLARFSQDVTRVEVHLSDENSDKKHGTDKRCVMEARLVNHQPVAVDYQADTVDEAFRGAEGKLKRLIESTLEKLNQHNRDSIRKNDLLQE